MWLTSVRIFALILLGIAIPFCVINPDQRLSIQTKLLVFATMAAVIPLAYYPFVNKDN
ncbi:hypothetical protein [Heyndrickxia oleronia]|uniref:hypothetical protein n=1 Tax=Heyndrickxia oleronia TaxID=38875 RepID=UPI001B28F4C2|nr:hypothetical protein [Heyndrickxia oleronia]GIN41439.1 hypothetical protein J19TS1_43880 [Heyndrickxia oleronia]